MGAGHNHSQGAALTNNLDLRVREPMPEQRFTSQGATLTHQLDLRVSKPMPESHFTSQAATLQKITEIFNKLSTLMEIHTHSMKIYVNSVGNPSAASQGALGGA